MTYNAQSPLLGLGVAFASQIQAWFRKHNASVPVELGAVIAAECSKAGVNSDLVSAQVAHETGWWTSYAAMTLNNPAGVGITNDLPQDQWPGFPSITAGIHAQIAHLLTYIEGAANPWKAEDPRYQAAVDAGYAGKVQTVGGLGGTWAWPGTTYGASLVSLANDLISSGGVNVPTTDDPKATWAPSVNFDSGRGGTTIDRIILHTTEGGYTGSLHWLQGPPYSSNTGSSTHYLIDADGTNIVQLVREADTAWTAGVYSWNKRSINIEQVGYAGVGGFSNGLYEGTAGLVARIAARHNIPIDRVHVIGHSDVPAPNDHTDPGQFYDFAQVIALANGQQPPAPPVNSNEWTDPDTNVKIIGGMLARWKQVKALLGDEIYLIVGHPVKPEEAQSDGSIVQKFEHCTWRQRSGQSPERYDVLVDIINPYEAAP